MEGWLDYFKLDLSGIGELMSPNLYGLNLAPHNQISLIRACHELGLASGKASQLGSPTPVPIYITAIGGNTATHPGLSPPQSHDI